MSEERRQSEREFPRRLKARLEFDSVSVDLRMIDISKGGVGLFSANPGQMNEGKRVEVTIENEPPREGIIRYVKPHPYGGYHVGIEWL